MPAFLLAMNIKQLVEKIGQQLKEENLSLVTVESCTGGGISYAFTQDAEASSVLERGLVVYSMAAKDEILGISADFLQAHALVSEELAMRMAEKGLEKSKAHISLAVTGMEGGEGEKGCVWISCAAFNKETLAKKVQISSTSRKAFCEMVVLECLKYLNKYLTIVK